jgi:hypothetical protein
MGMYSCEDHVEWTMMTKGKHDHCPLGRVQLCAWNWKGGRRRATGVSYLPSDSIASAPYWTCVYLVTVLCTAGMCVYLSVYALDIHSSDHRAEPRWKHALGASIHWMCMHTFCD